MKVRAFCDDDLIAMLEIWNTVVREGNAFPQTDFLDYDRAARFFGGQSRSAVAVDDDGKVVGLYILHPNNVGRCGHIANASYAVHRDLRGQGIGRKLVEDSLRQLKPLGFRGLQFNAVVESNEAARELYEDLGFTLIGTIPGGFRIDDDTYENTCIYYYDATTRFNPKHASADAKRFAPKHAAPEARS